MRNNYSFSLVSTNQRFSSPKTIPYLTLYWAFPILQLLLLQFLSEEVCAGPLSIPALPELGSLWELDSVIFLMDRERELRLIRSSLVTTSSTGLVLLNPWTASPGGAWAKYKETRSLRFSCKSRLSRVSIGIPGQLSSGKSREHFGKESLVVIVNGWTFLAVPLDMVSQVLVLRGPQQAGERIFHKSWLPRQSCWRH